MGRAIGVRASEQSARQPAEARGEHSLPGLGALDLQVLRSDLHHQEQPQQPRDEGPSLVDIFVFVCVLLCAIFAATFLHNKNS